MKKAFFFAGLFLAAVALAQAFPWAITVNHSEMSISIIDLGTNPPKVYGPFLKGQLGEVKLQIRGNNWYDWEDIVNPGVDVVVTPDGRYAIVSNKGGQGVYKVDLADPTHPVFVGAIDLRPYWPGEVDVTPDGKTAVLPDAKEAALLFIDISSFQSYSAYPLQVSGKIGGGPVACGPGGMIIVAPFVYGRINDSGTSLLFEKPVPKPCFSLDLSISPDGSTILSTHQPYDSRDLYIQVYKFDDSWNIHNSQTFNLEISHFWSSLSTAFSRDGRKAYYVASRYAGFKDVLYEFVVTEPGQVFTADSFELLSWHDEYSESFIKNALGISPDGRFAVMANPESQYLDAYDEEAYKKVQLINLEDHSVSWISVGAKYPWAVECFNTAVLPPVDASIRRTSNSYVFYKEPINRLTWQPDTRNYSPIAEYRIYRKLKSDDDDAYRLLAEVLPIVTSYADRRLAGNTAYSYRITAVNAEGRESAPTEVSN